MAASKPKRIPFTASKKEPVAPIQTADEILHAAADVIDERGVQRDSSAGTGQPQERSMAATVAAFNAIEGLALTERQGWAFMQVLKMVRGATTARNGLHNVDDALDGAAYAALGGEAAARAAAGGQA